MSNQDYEIGICFFSAKHTAQGIEAKASWLKIKIMCLSGATCLPAEHYKILLCSFVGYEAYIIILLTCSCHDIAEKLLIWLKNCSFGIKTAKSGKTIIVSKSNEPLIYFEIAAWYLFGLIWFMVFRATFNNISVISWISVLLVEQTGISEENQRPVASR